MDSEFRLERENESKMSGAYETSGKQSESERAWVSDDSEFGSWRLA